MLGIGQLTIQPLLTDLLIGYMTLFSIINSFGIAFVFHSKTAYLPVAARNAICRRIGLYSFIILVVSLFIGSQVLRFFGISIPALRIAVGLVVVLSGWSMLTAPDEAPAGANTSMDRANAESMVFFPSTIPLTTGPGTIAAAIALGAHRTGDLRFLISSSIASVLLAARVAVTIVFAYSRASFLSRMMGHEGTRVITRLSAFLLMCVGVQC